MGEKHIDEKYLTPGVLAYDYDMLHDCNECTLDHILEKNKINKDLWPSDYSQKFLMALVLDLVDENKELKESLKEIKTLLNVLISKQ